jgi:hypothetical protein
MNKVTRLLVIGCFFAAPALNAQKGAAPDGYYPANYSGSTFTGTLQRASSDTSRFTLVYTKNGKSETFTAQLEAKCKLINKAGVTQTFGMEAFSEGAVLTAYYRTTNNKTSHQKENIALALSFAEKRGSKIPDDKRMVIMCSEQNQAQFKAFSADRSGAAVRLPDNEP